MMEAETKLKIHENSLFEFNFIQKLANKNIPKPLSFAFNFMMNGPKQ